MITSWTRCHSRVQTYIRYIYMLYMCITFWAGVLGLWQVFRGWRFEEGVFQELLGRPALRVIQAYASMKHRHVQYSGWIHCGAEKHLVYCAVCCANDLYGAVIERNKAVFPRLTVLPLQSHGLGRCHVSYDASRCSNLT